MTEERLGWYCPAVLAASGGFPNASYLLSEKTEIGSSIYYEEFSGTRFVHLWRFWQPISVDWAIHCVRDIKPIDQNKIWNSGTEIFLRLANYSDRGRNRVYLRLKEYPESEYFNLLRAAISSPVLTRCTKVHVRKLCDGQVTNSDVINHVRYALDSDCTDLLIIYNQEVQKELTSLPLSKRYFEVVPNGASKISIFETRTKILKKAHQAMKEQTLAIFRS